MNKIRHLLILFRVHLSDSLGKLFTTASTKELTRILFSASSHRSLRSCVIPVVTEHTLRNTDAFTPAHSQTK